MTDHVYLNASRTKLVDKYAPGKKYQVSVEEAERLGFSKPTQERRVEPAPVGFENGGPNANASPKRKYTKRKP